MTEGAVVFDFQARIDGAPFDVQWPIEPEDLRQAGAIALEHFWQRPGAPALRLESEIHIKASDRKPWGVAGTISVREILDWAKTSAAREFFERDLSGIEQGLKSLRSELGGR